MPHTNDEIDAAIKLLTNDDAVQFFNERIKQNNCPACFTNHWSFIGGGEHTLAVLALRKDGTFGLPPPNVPMFAIACNNCGFIRSHALGIIAQWKLDRNAGPK